MSRPDLRRPRRAAPLAAGGATRRASRLPWLLTVALLILLAARTWLLTPLAVEGESMTPTVEPGQHLLVWRLGASSRHWEHGDVALVERPGSEPLVKRVVGLAGDTVEIRDGELFRNGVAVPEEYADPDLIDSVYVAPVTVPAGEVYVLGDHRSFSLDSRTLGTVPTDRLSGEVVAVAWPPGDIRLGLGR